MSTSSYSSRGDRYCAADCIILRSECTSPVDNCLMEAFFLSAFIPAEIFQRKAPALVLSRKLRAIADVPLVKANKRPTFLNTGSEFRLHESDSFVFKLATKPSCLDHLPLNVFYAQLFAEKMSELLSALECDNVTFCDPLLTTAIDSEWGVWGSDETAIASPTESTRRDRCRQRPVNQQRYPFNKEGNCVFKWAETTTATTAACELSDDDLMRPYTSSGPSPSCFGCGPAGPCIIGGYISYHSSVVSHEHVSSVV
ncbi:hypothetical protein Q1695_009236 [Nippostrongylus brasiliensis]|nr:hypothetical protein Q1695_009236 [Nippostrongylus brasiliensis]